MAAALVATGGVVIDRKHRRDGRVALDRYGRTLAIVTVNSAPWLDAMRGAGATIRAYDGRARRQPWC